MGLLILESTKLAALEVPGSALLEDLHDGQSLTKNAKHAGNSDLILVPTPSDSPSDPLNWSWAKKESFFLSISFGTVLAGVQGPIVAPAFIQLVSDLNQSLNRVVQINGALVLTIGFGSIFFAPIQTKWGSRPAFLAAALLLFVSNIWAAASSGYNSLIAARAVQGIAMGCYFSNVPASINNVYFVHQRGFRLAIWNLSLIGGINLGPVISAQIIQATNWHVAFWGMSGACGLSLLLTIFFVGETDRSAYIVSLDDNSSMSEKKDSAQTSIAPVETEVSYRASLKPFSGSKSDRSFWVIFARPFFYITNPATIFGALVFSVTFNWLPLVATVYAQIFAAPPYSFSTGAIGLISGIPPLIGTIIGTFSTGPLSDWCAKRLAKANGGRFEPEYRLLSMIGFAVFGGMGAFGWGLSSAAGDSWIVISVFIAILHVGISAGTIGCISYVSESTGAGAADAVGLVVLVKSVIGFGLIFVVTDWLSYQGVRGFFVSLGCLTVAVSALAVPMWVFGKQCRAWSSTGVAAKGRK